MQKNSKNLSVGLLIIGDEILNGQTKEKNIFTIANFCVDRGLELKEVRIVGDNMEQIVNSLNSIRKKYDYIFTTGGIGPTHDDITAMAVAKAFNIELELNEKALEMLKQSSNKNHVSEGRKRMALIPKGARLIRNFVSGAPGFIVENCYILAGVPKIMQAMLEDLDNIIPTGVKLYSKTLYCGVGESVIASKLSEIQQEFSDVKIGSYPQIAQLPIYSRIILRSPDKERLEKASEQVQKMLDKIHKKYDINIKNISGINNNESS